MMSAGAQYSWASMMVRMRVVTAGSAGSGLAEHAPEDRVDVFEVIAEVELFLDLGIAQVFLDVCVLFQQRQEIARKAAKARWSASPGVKKEATAAARGKKEHQ